MTVMIALKVVPNPSSGLLHITWTDHMSLTTPTCTLMSIIIHIIYVLGFVSIFVKLLLFHLIVPSFLLSLFRFMSVFANLTLTLPWLVFT